MDFRKYLVLALTLVLCSSSIVNHKVTRNVNYDGPNTIYSTQIEFINSEDGKATEVNSY